MIPSLNLTTNVVEVFGYRQRLGQQFVALVELGYIDQSPTQMILDAHLGGMDHRPT